MTSLERIQNLYDRNQYLQAYRESAGYWTSAAGVKNLGKDELILGARLAARLGASRVSRWLLRAALNKYPSDARVRFFSNGLQRRGRGLFEQLKSWEADPELPGATVETRAHWFALQAVMWATVRDFSHARSCIERARSSQPEDSWVLSCASSVFGMQDKWKEALNSAELSWEKDPGTPWGAQSLGQALLSLGNVREAAERLALAGEAGESFEVAQAGCWHLCTLAEGTEGGERRGLLERARKLAERLPSLAALADRETRTLFARIKLDIAELQDDHAGMEKWAQEVRSPFHRKVLENLRKNPDGSRIRLPYRRAIQKHEACLPTSIASVVAAMGKEIDPDGMAAEITFGGTAEWAAAEWLKKRGFETRFFVVLPEIAVRLLKNGIAFVVTLESDASAHAVAAVGADEAAGTLIIHDPTAVRTMEYLLESVGQGEAPLGPKGMAIVSREKAALLDELLPKEDVEAVTATEAHHRAMVLEGAAAAREVVKRAEERIPAHAITRFLKATQAVEDGRVGVGMQEFQELLKAFPASGLVRARVLASSRSLGNTALTRAALEAVVERGMLPGIQSRQSWLHPPSAYVSEYADQLRMSAETRERARQLLYGVIARDASHAQAWHVLGDLLWDEHDRPGALLAYRIATGLGSSNEHYARAYCDALEHAGRGDEGLRWLEERAHTFGTTSPGITTWITWIDALEDLGQPERALAAAEEALKHHGESTSLLGFVAPFLARMGRWEEAEALLRRLEGTGNTELFHEAAADFYERRGELEKAQEHAEARLVDAPLSISAMDRCLHLTARRNGERAALKRVAVWREERRGHDELEQLYCQYLDRSSLPRWMEYSVLLRRLKRNPEDGWAWRELTFACIADYDAKEERRRERLRRRVLTLVAQCDRTAPNDPATLRVHARWCEVRGEWKEAIHYWMESIRREPGGVYSYQQVRNCFARLDAQQRKEIWQRLSELLLSNPGRLSAAPVATSIAAEWFGVAQAEEGVSQWKKMRAGDPEVTEAYVDLLLEQGQGRTDAQRALDLLKPAVEAFPFHIGLRFSLANALRRVGKFGEAEEVLAEIIRRHPGNTAAQIQLAGVRESHGRMDEALRVLESAIGRDARNAEIRDARVQTLIRAGRHPEARAAIREGVLRLAEDVPWRERAIRLSMECGDAEGALQIAREGTRVFPWGAYLWFLLGRTLNEMRRFAGQGEIEACLRRSLALNQGFYAAADMLAMILVEQRRYEEAEEVTRRISERLRDPTPAQGRLAWIHREKGTKTEAREELASVVRATPPYVWGWNVLMEWLVEDKAWPELRSTLGEIPPELRTDTGFRRRRLQVLETAGLAPTALDAEWNALLEDFPEDVALHLYRYDSLRNAKRVEEAGAVLEHIRSVAPEDRFVLARLVEVLCDKRETRGEAIDILMRIWFAEIEESTWPADYGWKAVQNAHVQEEAYEKAFALLKGGSRPTLQAMSLLAAHAGGKAGAETRPTRSRWQTWFPERGGREVLELLKIIDSARWGKQGYRGRVLKQLSDLRYHRLVVRYWKKNEAEIQGDVDCWAEMARALINLKRQSEARRLLAVWRGRVGVGMWAVANYTLCLSALRRADLEETVSCCRDALAGLPHDGCAKYLAHRQAEACALLGDEKALTDTWNEYRNYFDAKVEQGEWFESKRKDLLLDVPIMARALRENDLRLYRKTVRSLRWKRFTSRFQTRGSSAQVQVDRRWWWLLWIVFWLLTTILRNALSP